MNEETKQYPNPIAERESKPAPAEAPDFLKGDDWYGVDIHEDFLDFTERYQPPRYTLQRHGIKFANVGDLHIISGKPGNGKTGLMTQFMAALLCGKNGNTEYALPSRKPKVLYVDTEQSKDDSIALKNRVCVMANRDYTKAYDDFFVLRLRDTESEIDRWRKVLKAIYEEKQAKYQTLCEAGMEAKAIARAGISTASTHYDSSLWMVLHENPMVNKLVGTLGSIAQRKVTEIFSVVKVKQADLKPQEQQTNMPPIYFIVNQEKARGKDVDRWYYHFAPGDAGWGLPEEIDGPQTIGDVTEGTSQADKKDETEDPQIVKNMLAVIGTSQNVSRSALRERIKKEHKIGSNKADAFIAAGVKFGFLTLSDNTYTANPVDLYTQPENEMPF